MRRKRLAFAGLVGISSFVALAFLPTSAPAAAAVQFGGYDNFGFAAPVSVLVYEPFIPVPVSPQGEMRYSYTESTLQSGPFGAATASTVWPGATLATGLPAFNKNLPAYPVVTFATYPGTKDETSTSKTVGPGQMTANASAAKVAASALTGGSSPASAISFSQASSTTTDTLESSKVTSTAIADVSNLGLMGSIIGIKSIHSEARASSDGKNGSATGKQVVSGLTVAGQTFQITDKGVQPPSSIPGFKLPGAPKSGAQLLQQLGISFSEPASQSTIKGTAGANNGQALIVSVATKTFHDALGRLPIRQLIALTPNPCFDPLSQSPTGPCLHDQLDAVLSLSPRIDFLIGNVSAASNGVPQFVVPPFSGGVVPPTTTTIPGIPGTPGTPGTASIPGGTADTPAPDVAAPAAANTTGGGLLPAGYGGLKAAGALGVLASLATWYAIRNLGLAVVGGFAGCEYGAPRTVPDLRRG